MPDSDISMTWGAESGNEMPKAPPPKQSTDVLKELEDFVKPRRKNKKALNDEEDVYDMCDQMLNDLSYLDA